jgi:phage terminase small subunit
MALTPKQELFAREYLVDLNATQAALRAGYSARAAHVQGSRLLTYAEVAAFIAEHHKPRLQKLELSADRVVNELARIGLADPRRAMRWGKREITEDVKEKGSKRSVRRKSMVPFCDLVDSDDLDDDTAAAIAGVKMGANGVEIRFHDKRAALVDLGRHLGVFKESIDITVPVTFVIERTRRSREAA